MARIQVPSYISPAPAPGTEEGRAIMAWVMEAFQAEGRARQETETLRLTELHVAIAKPRDGMVVFADGTDWNPGSGRGYYGYYSAAWHFLG